MTDADLPEWVTLVRAATILGVSEWMVRNRVDTGQIKFTMSGQHRRVLTASLEYRDLHKRPVDETDYTGEQWRPVVGYEGKYLVSDRGRVRNCQPSRRILRYKLTPRGYRVVSLYQEGCPEKHARIHRLVLEAFVGPCPPGMETCHRDCNPANNELSNLRWDTHPENMKDSILLGRLRRISTREPRARRKPRAQVVYEPRKKPAKTHCKRGHPQTEWNTALRFRDAPRNHCVACERAGAAVRKSIRKGEPTPGMDVVADQKFMELKAQHENQQAA